jgi:hypothetical protein
LRHVGEAHAKWFGQLVGLAIGSGLPSLEWRRINARPKTRQMERSIIQYIQHSLSEGERIGQEIPRQIENCIIVTIRVFGKKKISL